MDSNFFHNLSKMLLQQQRAQFNFCLSHCTEGSRSSGSMRSNAAEFPAATPCGSCYRDGRGSPRPFLAGGPAPRRTRKGGKRGPLYPGVSVVSGDALSFVSLVGWRTGERLSEEPAGGLSFLCLFSAGGGPWGRSPRRRPAASRD